MLDVPTILVLFGALLFLLALFGSGLTIQRIRLPAVPQQYRLALFLMSFVFMGAGIWLWRQPQSLETRETQSAGSVSSTPCKYVNLLNSSTPFPVFIEGESRSVVSSFSGGLVVQFANDTTGSGLALQFGTPLDVRGCKSIGLTATSSAGNSFIVEYKIRTAGGLTIVQTSTQQTFPSTLQTKTVDVPIRYNGLVDEIVLNFNIVGESSELVIESIRVSP